MPQASSTFHVKVTESRTNSFCIRKPQQRYGVIKLFYNQISIREPVLTNYETTNKSSIRSILKNLGEAQDQHLTLFARRVSVFKYWMILGNKYCNSIIKILTA